MNNQQHRTRQHTIVMNGKRMEYINGKFQEAAVRSVWFNPDTKPNTSNIPLILGLTVLCIVAVLVLFAIFEFGLHTCMIGLGVVILIAFGGRCCCCDE